MSLEYVHVQSAGHISRFPRQPQAAVAATNHTLQIELNFTNVSIREPLWLLRSENLQREFPAPAASK